MADILFPLTSTPGEHAQSGRGRLINIYADPIITDDRKAQQGKYAWRRVAGSLLWGEVPGVVEPSRNLFFAGGRLYHPHGNVMHSFGVNGTDLTSSGTIPGAGKVIWAKDNKIPPNIVAVAQGFGAYIVTPLSVAPYGDVDMPLPNSVCFVSGFFIFSIGDGRMFSTDVGVLDVNALNFATADTRPDGLLRVVNAGNGQLLACGETSMEIWGPPINSSAFPFSYISSLPYGLIGRNAVAGYEEGWPKGIFFVSTDFGVYTLNNFQPVKISPPDLDRLIKLVVDKNDIEVSVMGYAGRGIVIVQTPNWSWHFDCNTLKWHERQSYLHPHWRHIQPVYAWNVWLAGDRETSNVYMIDHDVETEAGEYLTAQMSGLVDVFPLKTRIARIDIDCTHGVGITTGTQIIQTDPTLHIAYSNDGGVNWSDPVRRPFGRMGEAQGVTTVRNCGITRAKQFKVKLTVSDPVSFEILGGAVEAAG